MSDFPEETSQGTDLPKILSIVSLAVVALALGVLAAQIFGGGGITGGSGQGVGGTAPPVHGWDTSGREISLADYEGQVVVLDFWATWCGPCVTKLPELIAVQEKYADQGVQVIGVSGDRSIEDLRGFEENSDLNFPTIFNGAREILDAYEIRGFPTIVVIDQNGRITHRSHHGNVENEVTRLL